MKQFVQTPKQRGFTLVEVMVALVILGMTTVTIVSLQRNTVKNAVYARELTIASMLARSIMVDTYLAHYQEKLSDAIKTEKNGESELAGLKMKWRWSLHSVPLQIPTQLNSNEEDESGEETQQNPMLEPIIRTINTFLEKAMRELSVVVTWKNPRGEESVRFVTHLIDFSNPLKIPKLPLGRSTTKQGL